MLSTRRTTLFVVTFMFALPVSAQVVRDGGGTPWLSAVAAAVGAAVLVTVALGTAERT